MFKFKKKNLTASARRRPGDDASGVTPKTANVFSYRASRSKVQDNLGRGDQKTDAIKTRKGRTWVRRTKSTIIALLVLAFVAFNLWLGREPAIVMLGAEGDSRATYRDAAVYQMAAERALSSSVFNTNKITINKAGIEESLKRSFPELSNVSVSLPVVGHKPTLYLQPSTSRLILKTRTSQELVLDTTGKAVASGQIVKSLREAGLPTVQDQSSLDPELGDVVLPSSGITFITEVARQLKAKGLEITDMTLPASGNELQVRIKGAGYYIKFNTRGDARVEAGSFLALKQYLESQKKVPAEYVDVRVENRAYFK